MPIIGGGEIWNDPSWSISVESWVYVLVFGILGMAQRRSLPIQSAVVAGALLFALTAVLCTLKHIRGIERNTWIAFARAAIEFTAGWAAYRMAGEMGARPMPIITDMICVVVAGSNRCIWRRL